MPGAVFIGVIVVDMFPWEKEVGFGRANGFITTSMGYPCYHQNFLRIICFPMVLFLNISLEENWTPSLQKIFLTFTNFSFLWDETLHTLAQPGDACSNIDLQLYPTHLLALV